MIPEEQRTGYDYVNVVQNRSEQKNFIYNNEKHTNTICVFIHKLNNFHNTLTIVVERVPRAHSHKYGPPFCEGVPQWKVAKVIPFFKGGNRETVGNYGPVSLLPLPGKRLEKIVHKRITDFCRRL